MKHLAREALRLFVSRTNVRGRARLIKILNPYLMPVGGVLESRVGEIRFSFNLANWLEQLWYFGFAEKAVFSFLREQVNPGAVVFDVGANIGYVSAVLAGLVGRTGAVHSFEPVPQYFARLRSVADAAVGSGFNIHAVNLALGDKAGKTEIEISKSHNTGWNTIVPGLMKENEEKEKCMIEVETFDGYLEKARVDPASIQLVKIDVEGAEPLVIGGMKRFFTAGHRPIIVFEFSPQAFGILGVDRRQYLEDFLGLGYIFHRLTKSGPVAIPPEKMQRGENYALIPGKPA